MCSLNILDLISQFWHPQNSYVNTYLIKHARNIRNRAETEVEWSSCLLVLRERVELSNATLFSNFSGNGDVFCNITFTDPFTLLQGNVLVFKRQHLFRRTDTCITFLFLNLFQFKLGKRFEIINLLLKKCNY